MDILGFEGVQARIGDIQQKIGQVSRATAAQAASASSFAATLASAQTAPAPGAAAATAYPTRGLPPAPEPLLPGLAPPPSRSSGGAAPGGRPAPPNFVGPMPVLPRAASPANVSSGVARWDGLIQKYAAQYNVPANLVRAVMQMESEGNPRAVSRAGAMGLMQLMPANCRESGVTDPFDPEQNIRSGVAQLREHLSRYKGDVPLALAAYNAGPGNVRKYGGIPPFRETQNYVRKIMARIGDQG